MNRQALLVVGALGVLGWLGLTTQKEAAESAALSQSRLAAAAAAQAASAAAAAAAERRACTDSKTSLLSTYRALVAAKRDWDAARSLDSCMAATGDPDLQRLINSAELTDLWRSARDSSQSLFTRLRALEIIERDHASQSPAAQRMRTQLEGADKRSRGVRLGMSPEDVLASSWGKPSSINRTVNQYGYSEQWVYGSGSYLYFTDGKLTSIQN